MLGFYLNYSSEISNGYCKSSGGDPLICIFSTYFKI